MTDPPWAELPLTSVGHRPLRVRGQALPELPLLLLGHIQTKVLQNLEQKQEAFKKENTGKSLLPFPQGHDPRMLNTEGLGGLLLYLHQLARCHALLPVWASAIAMWLLRTTAYT